jgi:hypothetical protein
MSLVDLLANAAGGGIFGSILHLGTSFFDTWKKKKDAEVQIMLMQAQSEAASKAAAWDAFAKSQQSQAPFAIPANVPGWVGAIYTCVEAFKTFTRPGLTWALLGVLVVVYFHSTPEVRVTMTGEITFGAFTALFWWFGSRYTSKGRA